MEGGGEKKAIYVPEYCIVLAGGRKSPPSQHGVERKKEGEEEEEKLPGESQARDSTTTQAV